MQIQNSMTWLNKNKSALFQAIRCNAIRTYYVPSHQLVRQHEIDILQRFIDTSHKLNVLTGAGISTESGIPDYRSEGVGLYAKNGYKPMSYSEFLTKHSSRQRYWARSFISWNYFYNTEPNSGHLALTEWQRVGRMFHCVTQNVDRLHHKAGTESVIELHGNLYTVKCIQCNHQTSRILFQKLLSKLNKQILNDDSVTRLMHKDNYYKIARPDGDIDVNADFICSFQFPYCANCNGILKPDIVFFGDNVSLDLVNRIYRLVEESSHLLVLGSSLHVFSSYRFVAHAHKLGKDILIVNIGSTRADNLPNISKLNAKIGDILSQIKV